MVLKGISYELRHLYPLILAGRTFLVCMVASVDQIHDESSFGLSLYLSLSVLSQSRLTWHIS